MPKNYNRRKGNRRPNRQKEVNKTFHLICEGKNTEPDYFRSFPVQNIIVEAIGLGQQHKRLVESAIDYKKRNGIKSSDLDEIWVVFDFDRQEHDMPPIRQNFNEAIRLATKNDIHCATSNDSFEL